MEKEVRKLISFWKEGKNAENGAFVERGTQKEIGQAKGNK
jgi:hypothetical protein